MAKVLQVGFASALLVATIGMLPERAQASTSICDAVAGNLVSNCGFEGGVYSSGTNGNVPNSWTPNAAFDAYNSFNEVTSSNPNSGTYSLIIGNDDNEPVPTLSQTLTDVASTTYNGSIYINYQQNTDSAAFFKVLVDGTTVLAVNGPGPYPSPLSSTYEEFFFTFVGTGSDTLTIEANTNPGNWYVDDISVTGAAVSATPLPAALPLFASGLGAMGLFGWRRKRKNAAAIAA